MNRADWQQVAEERLLGAQSLLAAKRWSSAYYLAGYAVECGLKSCILARLTESPELIFEDKRFSERCWTHSIDELVKLAGLDAIRSADSDATPALAVNWLVAADWNEKSRYEMKTQFQAESLCNAILAIPNGVMQWIRVRW